MQKSIMHKTFFYFFLASGAASGTAVGSALSRGVGQASLNLMRARGIQNYILPNIIKGGV